MTTLASTAADAVVSAAVTAEVDCEQAVTGVVTQAANPQKINSTSNSSNRGSISSGSGISTITT